MDLKPPFFFILSIFYLNVEAFTIFPSQSQSPPDGVSQLAKTQHHQTQHASSPSPAPVSSSDEAGQAFAPLSSQDQSDSLIVVEMEAEDAPASSPSLAESQISLTPDSSPEAPSPSSFLDGIGLSGILGEAEAMLSPLSSSILGPTAKAPSPASEDAAAPTITKDGEVEALAPSPDAPFSSPAPAPGPSGLLDPDIALAIESRINQGQTDAQLAMNEARRLLNDPQIASSETGECLSKCVDKYAASLDKLNRAITDLGVRDVTLLADDFGAVEADISTCQACFTENIGEDSPLKRLEEATTKAARECLTVMDYAA